MPRVVIAAGGTAGHVVPALAVADALRAEGSEVSFIGAAERPEENLVPAAGYEIDLLRLRGLERGNLVRAAEAVGLAAAAMPAAGRLLRRHRAKALLGGGGYVAGPAGLTAVSLGIPLVLTEADSRLGLANRILARRAHRVCLAFPIAGRDGPRYLVTGRPVPAAIAAADRGAARRRFGIGDGERCLLVFGGSQGARSINLCALAAFAGDDAPAGSDRRFWVLHISGGRDFAIAREHLAAAGDVPRYRLLEYEPGLAEPLAACDLVLARAGSSIFEVAAAGRPAILVPYPHAAADHQRANARWMVEAGGAVVIEDAELEPRRLATLAAELLADDARLSSMAAASRALARPDAAERVAEQVLEAIAIRGRR